MLNGKNTDHNYTLDDVTMLLEAHVNGTTPSDKNYIDFDDESLKFAKKYYEKILMFDTYRW